MYSTPATYLLLCDDSSCEEKIWSRGCNNPHMCSLIGLIDPEHLRVRTNEAELLCSDMAWRWGPSPKIRPEPHPGVMKNNSQNTRSCPLVDLVDLVVVNHQLLILEDLPPLKRVLWISDSDP